VSTVQHFAGLGMAAIEDKRFDDAIAAFESAVALDPSRPDMNNALGTAHMHRGDVGSAIAPLERAVDLAEPFTAPEHQELKREFHMQLATAYQLMDRVAESAVVLRGVVTTWPDEVIPRLRLAQLLVSSCQLKEGLAVYRDAFDVLDAETKEAIEALVGSVEAFLESEHEASVFLQGHQAEYKTYFDEVASQQPDWYAEAARMAKGPDGEPVAVVVSGAKPYAFSRVDLVNPADGTVSSVYSDKEPMVVALNGLEALAQVPILLPWKGHAFDVYVCTQCPWHWLTVTVQFETPVDGDDRVEEWIRDRLCERIDPIIGDWYLAGYNGEYGTKDEGRFHYITDPEILGDRGVSYVVDLGRARYSAVEALMRKLIVLHDTHPIRRVIFGRGGLPE